ncbi:MAG TPA: hypothetical protein VGP17_14620 [Solirubrobacteraceae bacterium]|jgi:hypothetical protein|nr:hypothetical protein [Solirubrobacteraceae bacterium]
MKPRPPAPEPEFQQENDSPFLSLLEDIVLPIVQFIVGGLGLLVGGFLALWAVVIGILLVIAAVVGASWLFLLLLGYVGGH